MTFLCNCVRWPNDKLDLLNEIVERGRRITFRTFVKRVGRDQIRDLVTETFGFTSVEAMKHDWAIGFYRSEVFGKPYYYIDWSSIEYVFTQDGEF